MINYIFLISDQDINEEEEHSNETFQEDTVAIEVQETPEIGYLADKSRNEQSQSQSGRAADRNLNRK